MSSPIAQIRQIRIAADAPLAVIAGPCVIESLDHCLKVGEAAKAVCDKLGLPYIFKCSFDKANRTSIDSYRGPGLDEGLKVLAGVRERLGVPVLTDIHEPSHAAPAAEVCEILQIPAFLCRQTDLLVAAGKTGVCINIKKGQFLSADQMEHPVAKVRAQGADNILLTDRGTFFGYGRLVNDFAGFPMMRQWGPVVMDATHSCQVPGGGGNVTGGMREMVPTLAFAGMSAGADALFLEVHDNPPAAKSDAATVYPLDRLERLLSTCSNIRGLVQNSDK